ncbi:acyl-CoA dehydrogenase family protein [Gordonia humi]|uniref:Alkylation response protein AidB-like acyl-CoA dehydrogenase n=1 Tax=Gordonia humi TaxID=686429 RepID=A0A840EU89_9ACTN|nr:acyl-CoA dehydrogenase family protein [Gordonia humi]MBB4133853.1 alkylation response protein AidB-like acyl-CoA dehydrogenase [Gordonia humi]
MAQQTTSVDHDAETDDEFRARIRRWFAENAPGRRPRDPNERKAWVRAFHASMYDARMTGPSWPVEYGGMGLSFARQVIYQEEAARARVPSPLGTGLGIVAPTIIKYGTPEQRERWLGPMLRQDLIWCQGYSEPGAGSDLPALRTTARREGDMYIVNGQKVWTTHGSDADVFFTLVRTGTQESRQKGITYLIIDADSPGITVRPLRDITGAAHFAEVFFDDVEVPVDNRIGEENEGWPLVRTSLGHERAAGAMNQATNYRRILDELIDLVRERGLGSDLIIRDRIADFEIRVRLMKYNASRVINDIIVRGEPGAASSVSRLFITMFEQELHEFAVEMLGADGIVTRGSDLAVQKGRWLMGFIATRASTIGAGTSEIQRNTIAEQVLGLPRDPAMPAR